MKIARKIVAAVMILAALAALTIGVILKPGKKGEEI